MHLILTIIFAFFLFLEAANGYEVPTGESPIKIDLYGTVLFNAYWNSNGVFSSDIPLWVVSGNDIRAEDEEFGMIARQTRFGARIKAPNVGDAKLTGFLEVDFFGGFPNSGQGVSFADLRLRLAYAKLEWSNTSFLAGQDWIILAPLNPTSLSHYAVPGFAGSGNIWLRYPQVRLDTWRAIGKSKLGMTAGLLRPVSGSDAPSGGALIDVAGAGERSSMPFWQARGYYTAPIGKKTFTVALSGHYGQEDYKLGPASSFEEVDLDTWAIAGDFQVPFGNSLSLQGEIFTGSNLDSFQAGINQGFSLDAPSFSEANSIRAIDTTGGWVQLSITPPQKSNLSFHVAYGIDNPDDADLSGGQRSENRTLMTGIIWKHTSHFQSAYEYSFFKTKYVGLPENDASSINVAVGFFF